MKWLNNFLSIIPFSMLHYQKVIFVNHKLKINKIDLLCKQMNGTTRKRY